jgi:hypothetical protein
VGDIAVSVSGFFAIFSWISARIAVVPTISVDEISVPAEARTFWLSLQQLGPDYEIQMIVQESEWVPHAIEHIRVFVHEHQATIGAVGGYILKTVTDIFKTWALERLKTAPRNTEQLTIYAPDGKPIKTLTMKADSIEYIRRASPSTDPQPTVKPDP